MHQHDLLHKMEARLRCAFLMLKINMNFKQEENKIMNFFENQMTEKERKDGLALFRV